MRNIPVSLVTASVSFILLMALGPNHILFSHLATAFSVSMFILVLTAIQSQLETKKKGERQNG